MKRFAILDGNNVVIGVVTGSDEEAESRLTAETNIIHMETFLDKSSRKNMASIGGRYDSNRDAFLWPRQYPSWVLNEDTCQWEAPIAMPDDGKRYTWNEETKKWIVTEE